MTTQIPFVSLILLGGGKGSRMGSLSPKQFLPFKGKPLFLHSFESFQKLSFLSEIIIVCPKEHRSLFSPGKQELLFAEPGERRQDSLFRGAQKLSPLSQITFIHDAARPFVEEKALLDLLAEAEENGAATLALPVTYTIKECTLERDVVKTLKRENLWEIQTPQAIKTALLKEAIVSAQKNQWDVTDDVSLVECMGKRVKVVQGFSDNIKVTYPIDLLLAEKIYEKREKKI